MLRCTSSSRPKTRTDLSPRLSMFICTVAIKVTALFRGREASRSWCGRPSFNHVEVVEVVDEEKMGLMEDGECPDYEEAKH